ncbi:MAG: endonuclease/exonuclease/phosphatase family protein [Chitinophagaceae bacterium]|nr:endonuclease/exonuclease/phosphatase family protein [Chitinophagaceae bacterium]
MGNFFKSVSIGAMMLLNIIVAALYLACSFAPYMHPKTWWFTGFLGLFFPYFLVLLLLFFLFWIFVRIKLTIFPLLVMLAGFSAVAKHVSFKGGDDFSIKKVPGSIRFMSWNLRHFVPFDESMFKPDQDKHLQLILDQVKKYQPDVICFQEFVSMPGKGKKDPMNYLEHELGYKYHQFAGEDIFGTSQYSGIAIFSRFPIAEGGVVPFTPASPDGNAENTVFADVIDGVDTLRIYAVHLQSFGFGAREYKVIDDVKAKNDSSVIQSKQLIKKMRNTFYWHGVQSDFIVNEMAASPYPTFVMGDLNDVPGSYTYAAVRGNREDAFLAKGTGLGATFTSSSSFILQLLPTLRIDYIFHPQQYEALQFTQGGKRLSDHAFLVSDIRKK